MKKTYIFYFFIAIFLGIFASSCLVEPKFPEEPYITFNSIAFKTGGIDEKGRPYDTITIAVDFRDGDGDLGLNSEDTLPPFTRKVIAPDPITGVNDTIDNPDYFNFLCDIYVKQPSGEYELFAPDVLTLHGRFPRLNNNEKPTPLKGTVRFNHTISNPILREAISKNFLKYRVRIRDRKLNLSNSVDTDSLLVPEIPF